MNEHSDEAAAAHGNNGDGDDEKRKFHSSGSVHNHHHHQSPAPDDYRLHATGVRFGEIGRRTSYTDCEQESTMWENVDNVCIAIMTCSGQRKKSQPASQERETDTVL